MADHAANVALDGKSSWSTTDARNMARARIECANIRVCVDGARRGSGDSAAGVAIVAYYSDGTHTLWFIKQGSCLEYCHLHSWQKHSHLNGVFKHSRI